LTGRQNQTAFLLLWIMATEALGLEQAHGCARHGVRDLPLASARRAEQLRHRETQIDAAEGEHECWTVNVQSVGSISYRAQYW